jgi:tetratricopeptide (TPR) repeat protein
MAYLWLAQTYGKLGDAKARAGAQQKAIILADNANEKDRLYIDALHAQNVEKDEEKRIRILGEIARKYPKEKRAHYNLGIHHWNKKEFAEAVDEYSKALALDPNYGSALNGLGYAYADMGNFEKAIEYFEKYAAVTPGDANPLDSLAEIYFQIGRLDDSRKKYQQAIDVQPNYFEAYWRIAYVYALAEDYQKAIEWIKHLIDKAPTPGILAEAYLWQAFYHSWIGEVDQSRHALRLALEQAESVENRFGQAYSAWFEAWKNYNSGDVEASRQLFKQWFDLFIEYPHTYRPAPSPKMYSAELLFYLGLLDISQGRADSAESRLTEVEILLPEIAPVFKNRITSSDFRLLNGELLLAKGSLEDAVSVFEEELPSDIPYMHSWLLFIYNIPYPRDVLARIYQKQGARDKAVAEYERLITFDPDSKDRRLIHPLYYYRLAKLCDLSDLKGKAIENYEKFLTFWKDADPGIAEVEDARRRLAALKGD